MDITDEYTATLRAQANHPPIVCYDMSHPIDVIREYGGGTPTLTSRMGTGGNNVPMIVEEQKTKESFADCIRHMTDEELSELLTLIDSEGWGDYSVARMKEPWDGSV